MDQSLDDYVKEHKISGRGGGGRGRGRGRGGRGGGGRGGRSDTSSFYNQGTGGAATKKSGGKKGLMPDRTVIKSGRGRGQGGRGRGRGRGGGGPLRGGGGTNTTPGRIQKRAVVQGQSQSQQAAKKRLLRAKKTLQLAIQEATKVTKMTGNQRGARGANRSNFGAKRTTQRPTQRGNFNNRYLDRLDAAPRQSLRPAKQTNSRPAFYNQGSNAGRSSDRVVSTRGRRGRGRGKF